MSVLLTRITVIPMPTAQIQMELSHVLANLVLLAQEQIALVSKVPSLFLFPFHFALILNLNFVFCTSRCRRVYR